jgi:hypothetical protein
MSSLSQASQAFIAAAIALAAGLAGSPTARSQTVPDTIKDQDSIFIDGQSFKIIPGRPKPDAAARLKALGGRELGPGAIIYRMGDSLFIIGAPLVVEPNGPPGPGGPAGPAKPANPTAEARDEQLGRLRIVYEPPKNPEHQKIYEMLQQMQALETVQQMLSPARLPPEGLTIKTMGCDGLINSWYNTDDKIPTVHMCYELMQNIIKTTPAGIEQANISQRDAIIGEALFWTLHEVGHAAFDIYRVPLFGREEDAADLFSAYLLLHFGHDQARRWILGAAYSAEEFMKGFGPMDAYWSVHGLPQQRFYNLLCLAYGADPKMFAEATNSMMEKGYLPKRRADNCGYEFQTFDEAFKREIMPHLDVELVKKVMDMTWFPEPKPLTAQAAH